MGNEQKFRERYPCQMRSSVPRESLVKPISLSVYDQYDSYSLDRPIFCSKGTFRAFPGGELKGCEFKAQADCGGRAGFWTVLTVLTVLTAEVVDFFDVVDSWGC